MAWRRANQQGEQPVEVGFDAMPGWHRQAAHHLPGGIGGADHPGQGGAGTRGQPDLLAIGPIQGGEAQAQLRDDGRAGRGGLLVAAAFGNGQQSGIARLPGLPEVGVMATAITAIAEPVQGHALGLQILDGGRQAGLAAQEADGGEAFRPAQGGQRMQVIGVGTAEAHESAALAAGQAFPPGPQLVALVAVMRRRALIQAQHRQAQVARRQGGQLHLLQRGGWERCHPPGIQRLATSPSLSSPRCSAHSVERSGSNWAGCSTRTTGRPQRSPSTSAWHTGCW